MTTSPVLAQAQETAPAAGATQLVIAALLGIAVIVLLILATWALGGFEIFVIIVLTVILLMGRENHGRPFSSADLVIERD